VIAGNFPLALIDYLGSLWILKASGLIPHQTQAPALLTGFFALRWATLVAWTLLYVNAKQILSNAVLKESLRDAELATLRAQIHPHFLFNALNSIIAEASDSQKVRAITQSLADFLRFSLKQREGVEPLERELAALENYLLVQKIRFETDLEYHIDTEPRAALCSAPPFLILPLLENALKYGQQTSPSPLRIYIAASIRKERLCIVVKNTGQWVVPDPSVSLNTGLANLRRRLDLTYGESASLEIDRTEDGIIASIQIPATQANS
jgi:LytS/YehU family sensor histidine kinase